MENISAECEEDIIYKSLHAAREKIDDLLAQQQNSTKDNTLKKKRRNSTFSSDFLNILDLEKSSSVLIEAVDKIENHLNKVKLLEHQLKEMEMAWGQEKEVFTSQTNMLNSIIEDQQKKIHLLEKYIQDLELKEFYPAET